MGKYTLWFPLLFGLTIILMGCEERGRQPVIGTAGPSIHKLERLNASMRDSDLETAVHAKLETDPQLKSAYLSLSVNADAVKNEVTLSGIVRTHAARKKAIGLAKSAKPGVAVNDKIDVKPAA